MWLQELLREWRKSINTIEEGEDIEHEKEIKKSKSVKVANDVVCLIRFTDFTNL